MLAKPALHASQEPGPANSQVAHPALHCSHRPSISLYPARHAAHTVVEPTYCEQPGTEQAGRRLREEERERLPLSLPPQARDVSLTYDAASHPELRDWGHAKRSHAAISTATKRRIGTLLAATLKDKHVGLYFSFPSVPALHARAGTN